MKFHCKLSMSRRVLVKLKFLNLGDVLAQLRLKLRWMSSEFDPNNGFMCTFLSKNLPHSTTIVNFSTCQPILSILPIRSCAWLIEIRTTPQSLLQYNNSPQESSGETHLIAYKHSFSISSFFLFQSKTIKCQKFVDLGRRVQS